MSADASRLQLELSKGNAAFVAQACEHRESSAALVQRVKALEADLVTAKQTCSDQEYHIQQVARASAAPADQASVSSSAAAAAAARASQALQAAQAAQAALEAEAAGLRAAKAELEQRVRELEVVESGWKHLRAVLLTRP